ncbi:MAG: tyrosine-type recombinase/integrase [Streptosporangiales bacterium]
MAVYDKWHRTEQREGGKASRVRSAAYGTGKRWQVRWRDPAGAQQKRNFATQADAVSYDATVRTQIDSGRYVSPKAGRVTFREYAETWRLAQTHDLPTAERVERTLRLHAYPVLGDQAIQVLAARPSILQAWIRGLPGEPSSARQYVKDVSAVFTAALSDGLIGRNPLQDKAVRRPKVTTAEAQPWTAEQVEVMAAALPGRFEALAWLVAGTGMRQGEAMASALPDIDFLRRNVRIDCQVRQTSGGLMFAPLKNDKPHDVPVGSAVLDRLAEHVREYPPRPVELPWKTPDGKMVTRELLFTMPDGRPLNRARAGEIWRRAAKVAGLPSGHRNGMHVLRHTAASAWLAEGLSVATVASFLGDSRATVLATYAHFMPGDDARARNVMDRFLSGTQTALTAVSCAPDVPPGVAR